MTYIPVHQILEHVPNKFEAIRVLALECRRLNSKLTVPDEENDEPEQKITTRSVERLVTGEVKYYDARERREEERSEAMLAAAEGLLDGEIPQPAE